jgi:hypothetical protein
VPHLKSHAELNAMPAHGLDDTVTIGQGSGQGFLAEDMLAGGGGPLDKLGVPIRLHRDDDRVHSWVVDDIVGLGSIFKAKVLGRLPAALDVIIPGGN